jgi:anti-sigma B factor antagonist
MEITTTHLKRCDMIALKGRFDSSVAPDLEKAFRASFGAGIYRIVVDTGEAEYFGSAAIRALVMAYKECRRFNRGDVRLARVPERIRHVLDLSGIAPLMKIYDDPVLAVGSF